MVDTCLLLVYTEKNPDFKFEEQGIPNYIYRIDATPEIAMEHIEEILTKINMVTEGNVIILDGDEKGMATIKAKYEAHEKQYKQKVSIDIKPLSLDDAMKESFILAVYSPPIFPLKDGKIDTEIEPPLMIYVIENMVDSVTLNKLFTQILDNGQNIHYWELHDYSDELHKSFLKRHDVFIQGVNSCIECQKTMNANSNLCSNCKVGHMKAIASNLISQGIVKVMKKP